MNILFFIFSVAQKLIWKKNQKKEFSYINKLKKNI